MIEAPQTPPLGPVAWDVAAELCMHDYCGCTEESAPCGKAMAMAAVVMASLENTLGADQADLDNLASGCGFRICDGDCHSGCGDYGYED